MKNDNQSPESPPPISQTKPLDPKMLEVHEVDLGDGAFNHNMPCAVCRCEKAVLHTNEMVYLPCWSCRAEGYALVKKPRRWWNRIKFIGESL